MDEYTRLKIAIDISAENGEPFEIYSALREQLHNARTNGTLRWDEVSELERRLEIAWETGHDDEMERRAEGC